MKLSELASQLPSLEENHPELYSSLVDFSNLMISKGHEIHDVQFSKVSCSVYVEYSLSIECGYCVRFSDHAAKGNIGITNLCYYDHLSIDSNYEEVEAYIEENMEEDSETLGERHAKLCDLYNVESMED
jgi:hypothetical protein